jgi:16S rRNA (guanine527-N7)-methyltransferase
VGGDIAPPAPAAAAVLFGDRLPLAERYADLLVTDGVVRGLIGPREAPRIWDRHLMNCAAIAELLPSETYVVDVGSGAGLPGIVLAVARPDVSVVLVEPLARRTAFLTDVVADLGLKTVEVLRARAEQLVGAIRPADVVTARALAPLDRLAAWCLPLAVVGGRVLALKGASAQAEVAEHRAEVERLGGGAPTIRVCGRGLIDPPAIVVEVVRARTVVAPGTARSRAGARGETGAAPRRERRRGAKR